jgi:hypothetical protein
VEPCQPCATIDPGTVHLPANVDWIADGERLGSSLSGQLARIHANRPAEARQHFVTLAPNIRNPSFQHEPAYPDVALPDSGFQLLAAFRFWNIIQYWFPYRDVIGEDWHGVLRDVIPKVAVASAPPALHVRVSGAVQRRGRLSGRGGRRGHPRGSAGV